MRWFYILVLTALTLPALGQQVEAHGAGGVSRLEGKSVVTCFQYSTGEALAYASVLVFAPHDAKLEFQNGRADKNGCFVFLPDTSGEWRIIAEDGMGHRVDQAVPVADGGQEGKEAVQQAAVSGSSVPKWLGILCGISLILNVFTLPRVLRRKKQHS